jgi:serine/threonine protein phosphatase PrpC
MPGRASIVGAAETSVGNVRDHNEDAHFIDPENGIFIVCDGMGGHAAGEVASAIAVRTIRERWTADSTQTAADLWLTRGTPDARRQLIHTVQQGVLAAHEAIIVEASADKTKKGMGTTVVAAIVVGGDVVFAHCGDSRAYLVRDGITVQLTEDHTLLARLLAAGVDVEVDGDGARFKSMLTNALGIGHECKVSTFVVPVADGDRFLLCSDGITEYLKENEIGDVLTTMPSPARSAQRLVEIALERGGGDNATALVARVLEAGETARPSDQLRREEKAINACPLWAKLSPQQRLRAQRIALPRDHAANDKIPAQTLGDRVAWILVEGEIEQDGFLRGPGALIYPEALIADRPLPDKHGLAIAQSDVRALALRADDFKELCDDDPELGEHLMTALGVEVTRKRGAAASELDAFGDTVSALNPGDIARPAVKDDDAAKADIGLAKTIERPAPSKAEIAAAAQELARVKAAKAAQRADTEDIGRATTLRQPVVKPTDAEPAMAAGLRTRGSSPPLIVPVADTEAAVDEAMTGIQSGPIALPALETKAAKPAPVDDNEPEISVEQQEVTPPPGPPPAPPVAVKPPPAGVKPTPGKGLPQIKPPPTPARAIAAPAKIPPIVAKPAAKPQPEEPEISVEEDGD